MIDDVTKDIPKFALPPIPVALSAIPVPPESECVPELKLKPREIVWRTNVRLSEEEFKTIYLEAEKCGESMPGVLKRAYFSRLQTPQVLHRADAEKIALGMAHITSSIHQIARRVVKGTEPVAPTEFQELAGAVRALNDAIRGLCGGYGKLGADFFALPGTPDTQGESPDPAQTAASINNKE